MESKRKKVCFVTPNHIATNPRLIKEAMAMETEGYDVHVVFTQHTEYLAKEDFKILAKHSKWTYNYLNWSNKTLSSKAKRTKAGLIQKIIMILYGKLGLSTLALSKILLNRHYRFQLRSAIKSNADIFIAHNVGALPIAADAARKLVKPYAFDAEDFHRGQINTSAIAEAIVQIENVYIPNASYLSAASSLIANEYHRLYEKPVSIIRNVFPIVRQHANIKTTPTSHLKMIWFSQTVGTNRGLQDIFTAMKILNGLDLKLDVYGQLPTNVKKSFEDLFQEMNFDYRNKIFFQDPVSPDSLLSLVKDYDIGFATEPGFCRNNEIALSNKIFTYLVGGNAIVFSNTPAQALFFTEYPGIGFIYNPGDAASLAEILKTYFFQKEILYRHKKESRLLFERELNWEKEKNIFIQQVEKVLIPTRNVVKTKLAE